MATVRTDAAGIWRNRDYLLLLGGQVVSFVGDQMQSLALPLVVLAITGSVAQAGVVLGLNTVSFLAFGLVAGALVDRLDRKATMIWCEVGRSLITASVVIALWLDRLTMAHLCAVSVLTGMLTTVFQTANTAAIPNVVRPDQVPTALGYTQSAFNTVRVFGASLAGAVYAVSRIVPFAMNAVSFLVSCGTLRFMRAEFQEQRTAKRARLTAEISDGLAFVWRQPVIRFLTFVQAADNLRYGAGYLVIIMLAKHVGATPWQLGLVFSGAAIGALLGALVSGHATRRYRLGRIAVIMLWVEALVFPLYAVAPDVWLLGGVAFVESLVAPVYSVAMTTYRLSITPDALRGRVTSAVSTLTTGTLSVGSMAGGTLLGILGGPRMVLLSGLWLLALAVVTTANRSVRRASTAAEVAPAGEAG